MTIEYQDEGQVLHYTPDFHLVEAGQNVLVECNPEVFIGRSENQRKFQAAMSWCAERNWTFQLIADRQLRTGHRLDNIKLMTYYARLSISPQIKGQIHAILAMTGSGTTVGDVAGALVPDNQAMALPAIMHMAFHHEVVVPLKAAPLSLDSPISLPVANPLSQVKL